ncbi:BOLA class I histocompatibility antigen, alpha chain BL3-7 isoform X3 [Phascolarctos cinereus]|uniref:HLA class I histocompatibility antigen, alpha chain G-like isoform X3 n=2 Tax=Phascolarctos cinereus TaxID=38626 RepID=A0A6P5JFH1_PHACI|nr:HLA class I histocompatibility antigen, alpha chain G-like isoform X3 [Phascolarctos cinereus]
MQCVLISETLCFICVLTMGPDILSLFLLGTLALTKTWAGFHSLKYFQTSIALPGLEKPKFISAGYVNDRQFVRFDSDSSSQREEPLVPWMDQMGQGYWERNSRVVRETAHTFEVGLQNLQVYYNQSEGEVHIYQRLVGCETYSNGTFRRGFEQFAYDGQDYISPDQKTLSWTALVPPALNTKYKWEEDRSMAKRQKVYLEEKCVEWLHKYLELGKETLLRADPPSVRVTCHTALDGKVTLRCRAQNFYPSEISLTWLRDGEEQLQDMEFIETRPAGDGTFQKWAAVEITLGQEEKYICLVQHEGLPEPLIVKWEPQSSPTWITVGIAVVLIAVIAGVVIWRKRNSGGQGGVHVRLQTMTVYSGQMSVPQRMVRLWRLGK